MPELPSIGLPDYPHTFELCHMWSILVVEGRHWFQRTLARLY
jgi:hypothetical protein